MKLAIHFEEQNIQSKWPIHNYNPDMKHFADQIWNLIHCIMECLI